jgi:pimeloyl-ACP methyl ester carboxylesterase
MGQMTSRLYLSPGFFGFDRMGSLSYFGHLELALTRRFQAAGKSVAVHVVDAHPSASVRRRARQLASMVARTARPDDPIHLIGHSTGGLDARLVASPSANLGDKSLGALAEQIRTVNCIDTPHYGTPLATFFATVSGQRLLFLVSALTVMALKASAPPLTLASALAAVLGHFDEALGLESRFVDDQIERVVGLLDDASSRDLRLFLRRLSDDNGAMIQLMPEAMDLFTAGVEDRPGVRYHSTVAYAPMTGLLKWVKDVGYTPWGALSGTLFATLQKLTQRESPHYPCAPPEGADALLATVYAQPPPAVASDGVVPLRSQLWGKVIWGGLGDHLDVVGHFRGEGDSPHVDWMRSGARFDPQRFDSLVDALTAAMLAAE